MDLEHGEERMHHLLALVGSGRAGRGRLQKAGELGTEAEGECEGENGERGSGGENITWMYGAKGAAVTLASRARAGISRLHLES